VVCLLRQCTRVWKPSLQPALALSLPCCVILSVQCLCQIGVSRYDILYFAAFSKFLKQIILFVFRCCSSSMWKPISGFCAILRKFDLAKNNNHFKKHNFEEGKYVSQFWSKVSLTRWYTTHPFFPNRKLAVSRIGSLTPLGHPSLPPCMPPPNISLLLFFSMP